MDWDDEEDEESINGDDEDTIPCPHCHRVIYEDSVRCPYCEQYISEEESQPSYKSWWIILGAILCLVAMGLLLIS
jgi:uncharacterized paraquat-inducible protein A